MRYIFSLIVISSLTYSCARNPYSSANKSYKKQAKSYAKVLAKYPVADSVNNAPSFIGTVNFNMRKPNYVIIHHTAQNSCEQTLKTFTTVRSQVSAHYVICNDGTVHHMLNDYLRAWHGGVSKWGHTTDINSSSIGIELDNNGFGSFTEPQIASLLELLERLKNAYDIPVANFIGHADIAPGRKVDPNRYFPWQQLSVQGFGIWYDTAGVRVSPDFNTLQALRIIGYDIKKPEAAIQSFKLHFNQADTSAAITDADKKILSALVNKYQ
jgi:N-acetylmuramoyl-L-alanine amidase